MSEPPPVSILLVDDQRRNIFALEAALASVDCARVTAESGREALKRVLDQDFAVIVLDVRMPGMDGFETASLIRARDRSRSTPIIFLTAADPAGERIMEGYRLGAVDYIRKPFDRAILCAKVTVFVQLFRNTLALQQRTEELRTTSVALERSEDHFRALIENASDLILIIAPDSTIRYASPSVERTLGYSHPQIVGRRVDEFLHPDDVGTQQADLAQLLKTNGSSLPKSQRWQHVDGSYRMLESSATNLMRTPSVAGLLIHARDVTERHLAEAQVLALNAALETRVIEGTAALDVAEQHLRTVVNNTPVILFAVDGQGVFTVFEGFGLKALGMQPGQVVGQSAVSPPIDAELSPPLVHALLILPADVQRALAGETFVAVVEAFDGIFELTYSPNLDSEGVLVGAIGIAVDVSEQRALDKRKDAFVSTVSHELRTPLNGIIAVSQLLLGTTLDAAQQEYVEILHRSGQALRRLIDNVLTLARYESGKVAVEDFDLDVRLVLEDVTALMLGAARKKGLEIVAQVDHDVPRGLCGDPGRLRQILLNLVGNALKFADAGMVFIRARVDQSEDDHSNVRFEVQDSGIGIAADVQARLFQPFEQADSSTTSRFGGTGLGLAICRELVENLGGQLGVDSAVGIGSTFWFVLPVKHAEGMDLARSTSLGERRVLVICDAPVRATALLELIGAWSMVGTAVSDGSEAMALLSAQTADGSQPFDAAVVALEDAFGTGVPLARTLISRPEKVGQCVILASPVDQLEAIEADAPELRVISRPVRSAQLFDAFVERLAAQTPPENGQTAAVAVAPGRPRGSGEVVLVVEDVPMNQLVARRALENLGYRAVTAGGGPAALSLLAESSFAVVLMDCRMPGMDGFEATRRIRRHETTNGLRRTPIIALTADARDGDRASCLAAGMDDYMTKPLDLDDLARMLNRWVSGTQSQPPRVTVVLADSALARIRELQGPGDPDLLTEMIEAFLESAPGHLAQIADALAREDAERLADGAHTLKGGAAYLGAKELQQVCLELELRGKSGVLAGSDALVAALRTILEQTREALLDELARREPLAA